MTSLGGGLFEAYFDQPLTTLPLQAGSGPWLLRLNDRYQIVATRQTTDPDVIRLTTTPGAVNPGPPYCWYAPPPNDATSLTGIPVAAFEQAVII